MPGPRPRHFWMGPDPFEFVNANLATWRHWRAPDRQIGEKIFFAFLDELGNFKHFETYFFFGDFWGKNRQFGDLWRSGGRQSNLGSKNRQFCDIIPNLSQKVILWHHIPNFINSWKMHAKLKGLSF